MLNELRENHGTIIRTEEAMTPIEDGGPPSRTLRLQHSSSSLNRKRPASPVSLADINPRFKIGSLKKRIMHSDVYGTNNDEYPHTPTMQSDLQPSSPTARGSSSPTFSLEERRAPSYASPHTQGAIDDDVAMDDAFPNIDATNEDGMLSPDHAMSLPSPTLSPVTGAVDHSHVEYFGSPTHALVNRSPTPLDDD